MFYEGGALVNNFMESKNPDNVINQNLLKYKNVIESKYPEFDFCSTSRYIDPETLTKFVLYNVIWEFYANFEDLDAEYTQRIIDIDHAYNWFSETCPHILGWLALDLMQLHIEPKKAPYLCDKTDYDYIKKHVNLTDLYTEVQEYDGSLEFSPLASDAVEKLSYIVCDCSDSQKGTDIPF